MENDIKSDLLNANTATEELGVRESLGDPFNNALNDALNKKLPAEWYFYKIS